MNGIDKASILYQALEYYGLDDWCEDLSEVYYPYMELSNVPQEDYEQYLGAMSNADKLSALEQAGIQSWREYPLAVNMTNRYCDYAEEYYKVAEVPDAFEQFVTDQLG